MSEGKDIYGYDYLVDFPLKTLDVFDSKGGLLGGLLTLVNLDCVTFSTLYIYASNEFPPLVTME
jgi:hypothetical protein